MDTASDNYPIHNLHSDLYLSDLDLVRIAKAAGYSLKQGTNDCPFCGERTFVLRGNYFRCYRPKCGHHGSITEFLRGLNLIDSTESIWPWLKRRGLRDPQEWYQQNYTLESVYDYLKTFKQQAKAYLQGRHLYQFAEHGDYGYHPPDIDLRRYFSWEKLTAAGLLDQRGHTMQNRVIFPVRNHTGQMVHFMGRSLNPNDTLRWRATSRREGSAINSYLYNENRLGECANQPVLLCEGIPDALSLMELGFFAVASIGLEPRLHRLGERLAQTAGIIAIFDSDMMTVNNQRIYKSWHRIIHHLVNLQKSYEIPCICLIPPKNDLNDWLQDGLTYDAFINYLELHGKTLPDAVMNFSTKNQRSLHLGILYQTAYYKAAAYDRIKKNLDEFLDNLP